MRRTSWPEIALPALTLVFGLQMIRALLPYLQYLLSDRLGMGTITLGLVALAIFAAGFLIGPLHRLLGLRPLLLISAGGAGLARLGMQVWTGDPIGDMALAVAGTVCFILFLPLPLLLIRLQDEAPNAGAGRRLAGSLLLGLALDTALHGAFLTYDYIWQPGAIPLALTLLLLVAQLAALWPVQAGAATQVGAADGPFNQIWPWLAVGPFLFLELLVFQNIAHFAVLTGWPLPAAFLWVLVCHLAGLWLAMTVRIYWLMLLGFIGALQIVLLFWSGQQPPVAAPGFVAAPAFAAALVFLIGQVSLAGLVSLILARLAAVETRPGLKGMTLAHGLSMLLLVICVFAFYIAFSLPVPYRNVWLFGLAALLALAAAASAARQLQSVPAQPSLFYLGLPLLLAPLAAWFFWPSPLPTPTDSSPIRVITYNIHNGFNTLGQLDLEAIARVIEAEQADVVALQEVSRGWALNGSVDMAGWLSQRLGMPYTFTPTAGAMWGHAVLSRYPIRAYQAHPLPPDNLPLGRAFSYQEIDLGNQGSLWLLNTHYHHLEADSDIRVLQTGTIQAFLALNNPQMSRLILSGDLNAEPDSPEIGALFELGLRDAALAAGLDPGYTYHAEDPARKLDYLLISPDLEASDARITNSRASDHLPIITVVAVR